MNVIKNKRILASIISHKTEMSKKDVYKVFEALSSTVEETLKSGGEIVIPGGIKIVTKVRAEIPERVSKHPRTGDEMIIGITPSRKVVKAIPMQSLKNKIEKEIKIKKQ